jgi:hypothetical protein
MKKNRSSEGRTYGPESLKAIGQAFDELWQEIRGRYGDSADVVEAGRQHLGRCLFAIATDQSRDVEALKAQARKAMVSRLHCAAQRRPPRDVLIVRAYHRQRA